MSRTIQIGGLRCSRYDALAAGVYRSQQRCCRAEAMLEQVLFVQTKIFGSEHIPTLTAMHDIANVYHL
jgi:hypothetical protein